MRRKDKQIQDQTVIYKIIHNALVCRMGMVKGDKPYVIPLNFGFDGKAIYFHSALAGEKVNILKNNNQVCLEFEQDVSIVEGEKPCNWTARYFSVIIHGTAELIENPIEKDYGLAQVMAHYEKKEELHSFTDEELKRILVYKITPDEIVGKMSRMED